MALRLAGEEFSIVQGLDYDGWLRDIKANDSSPGLKVNQQGTGRIFDFQDGGTSILYALDNSHIVFPEARNVGIGVVPTVAFQVLSTSLEPVRFERSGQGILKYGATGGSNYLDSDKGLQLRRGGASVILWPNQTNPPTSIVNYSQ